MFLHLDKSLSKYIRHIIILTHDHEDFKISEKVKLTEMTHWLTRTQAHVGYNVLPVGNNLSKYKVQNSQLQNETK